MDAAHAAPARPSAPRRPPPAGAWDTHVHVFEATGAAATLGAGNTPYRAPAAPMAALDRMHQALGIDRAVLVQTSAGGRDYARFIGQLRANPRLRGVAVIDDDTSDAELVALDAAGVRGIRFHFVSFLGKRPAIDVFRRCSDRVAELGWHVLVHVEPDDLVELYAELQALRVPVVIDHAAHARARHGVDHPGFKTLLALHRHEHCFVKWASLDRWSGTGPPTYRDTVPLGRALVTNAPDRVLWATDWPHVMYKDPRAPGDPPPHGGHLLDLLYDIADDDETMIRRVLVNNPSRLYMPGQP